MKKILLLISLAFIFLSCEDSSVRDGRKLYKMYFDKTLKNPKSLVVYDEKYTKNGDLEVNWVLDVGAENSFGGMVRSTHNITTLSDRYIEVDGEAYKPEDLK